MWSLALFALAAVAVDGRLSSPPPRHMYEPLNKTMRRLEFDGPLSWGDIDSACSEQFPGGFTILGRDFLQLSEADRALCGDGVVPLGLLRKEALEPVVWPKTAFLDFEQEVNITHLARMRQDDDARDKMADHHRVGALDLATNQWRLVDEHTTFTCAICQRAWADGLAWIFVGRPRRPQPFAKTYTFRIAKTGHDDDLGLEAAIRRVEEYVKRTYRWEAVGIETLAVGQDGASLTLRMRTPWGVDVDDVSMALADAYGIVSWRDGDWCAAARLDGCDWEETAAGYVAWTSLSDRRMRSKICSTRMRADGDWDAVWDDGVGHWIDRASHAPAGPRVKTSVSIN